jgi:hypothetical protein
VEKSPWFQMSLMTTEARKGNQGSNEVNTLGCDLAKDVQFPKLLTMSRRLVQEKFSSNLKMEGL